MMSPIDKTTEVLSIKEVTGNDLNAIGARDFSTPTCKHDFIVWYLDTFLFAYGHKKELLLLYNNQSKFSTSLQFDHKV